MLLLWSVVAWLLPLASAERACEPIRIETCRGIGYNVTGMPNLVGHELQQDAELQLQTFTPLVQYECSSRLRFFLCAAYAPMCTEKVQVPIGPCRTLCEDVRARCQPVLAEFGLPWPAALDCAKFPPRNDERHMCMEGPPATSDRSKGLPTSRLRNRRPSLQQPPSHEVSIRGKPHPCRGFRQPEKYRLVNRTGRCAPLCGADVAFAADSKAFAEWWHVAWFGLCLACTLFNFLVVIIGEYKFRYPEGAVVIISGCFNACAVAHLIRQVSGLSASACHPDPHDTATALLIQEGLDNPNCTLTFVVLYFFRMAANGWWVVLCLTRFLVSKGWRLCNHGTRYHIFAWGLPAGFTVAALITRSVDADELLGTCFVGNQDSENLLTYVIGPSLLYLGLGVTFLALSLFPKSGNGGEDYAHVPTNRAEAPSTTSLVSFFAYLYVVPFLCILGAELYEYANRASWIAAGSSGRPVVEVFSLKLFMLQVMGILSILVVASSDVTRRAGQKFSYSVLRKKKPVPSYLQVQPPQPLTASCRSKRSISSRANSETIV